MENREIKPVFLAFLVMAILMVLIDTSSAATLELVNPGKLPVQLHEGDQINLTIKVKDLESDVKNITIETSLTSSGNKPIYDFGDLNPSINENRYNQIITLNISSLPPNTFQVSISGIVPSGETRLKVYNDIIISKFSDSKLKFYEVNADKKLIGIESFDLIIKKKEDFENTLGQVRRSEFDVIKSEVRKLFDLGLTTEAQNFANDMVKIKWPDNLLLLEIIKIDSDLKLNVIFIIAIVSFFMMGYFFGARKEDDEP